MAKFGTVRELYDVIIENGESFIRHGIWSFLPSILKIIVTCMFFCNIRDSDLQEFWLINNYHSLKIMGDKRWGKMMRRRNKLKIVS